MHKLTKIAMLAVVAGLTVVPAAMAAPLLNYGGGASYCADPMHKNAPQCQPGHGPMGGGSSNIHNGPPPPPPSGPSASFHSKFGSINFGFFGAPNFSITIGGHVPHSYNSLKPVPRSIYKWYPQYRGYLFFVGKHGNIVIVSPKTYRIVAVI